MTKRLHMRKTGTKNGASHGNEYLCAFMTIGSDGPQPDTVKSHLETILPAYMIPSKFIVLDSMPRTPNQKIDYKSLADYREEKDSLELPANPLEQKLLELWNQILRIDGVSVTESFFQLGGNSLNVMTLISTIHREFDIRIPPGGYIQERHHT